MVRHLEYGHRCHERIAGGLVILAVRLRGIFPAHTGDHAHKPLAGKRLEHMHVLAVPELGRHVGLDFETGLNLFLTIGTHLFALNGRIACRYGTLDLGRNFRYSDI